MLHVDAFFDEGGLTLSVRDRGPGIAPQDLQYLFERFFRGTGAQRRSFGTGMGLAIARGLLAALEKGDRRKLVALDEMKKSLLHQAFSGEL